jgi:hypothetical protein
MMRELVQDLILLNLKLLKVLSMEDRIVKSSFKLAWMEWTKYGKVQILIGKTRS